MSQPKIKRHFYDDAADAELRFWAGVTTAREVSSKHYRLVLHYAGQSRFVTYPCSPGDRRGALNHVGDIRRMLQEMGASKLKVVKTAHPKGYRPKAERARLAATPDTGRPSDGPERDPWAGLARIRLAEPVADLPKARDGWVTRIRNAIRRWFWS